MPKLTMMSPTVEEDGTTMYDYSQTPKYINHTDIDNEEEGTWTSQDENDNTLSAVDYDDGITLNGVNYYSAQKVEARLSEIQSWADARFTRR